MRAAVALLQLLVLAALAAGAGAVTVYRGDATAYSAAGQKDSTGTNSCGFGRLANRWETYFAAMNAAQVGGRCGDCIAARGLPGQTASGHKRVWVNVKVVDTCPGWACRRGSVDFSNSAFKAITGYSWSRKKIEWYWISCDANPNKPAPAPAPKAAPAPAVVPVAPVGPGIDGAALADAIEAAREALGGDTDFIDASQVDVISGPAEVAAGADQALLDEVYARREDRQSRVFNTFLGTLGTPQPELGAGGGAAGAAAVTAPGGAGAASASDTALETLLDVAAAKETAAALRSPGGRRRALAARRR